MSGQQELEVYNYIVSTVEEEFVLFQLTSSLENDGRFYGAEYWMTPFERTEGILAPYITKSIDPVEIVREIRDDYNIDGWISK